MKKSLDVLYYIKILIRSNKFLMLTTSFGLANKATKQEGLTD